MRPYERVRVVNVTNGARLETYAVSVDDENRIRYAPLASGLVTNRDDRGTKRKRPGLAISSTPRATR